MKKLFKFINLKSTSWKYTIWRNRSKTIIYTICLVVVIITVFLAYSSIYHHKTFQLVDDKNVGIDNLSVPQDTTSRNNGNVTRNNGNISLAFFYAYDCACTQDAIIVIEHIEEEYPNVKQYWYNISDLVNLENHKLMIKFFDVYNVPNTTRSDTPFVFIGNFYFHHYGIQNDSLSQIIDRYEGLHVPLWPEWEVAWTIHAAFFYNPEVNSSQTAREDVQLLNLTWNSDVTHLIVHNYSLANPGNKILFDAYFSKFNLSKVSPFTEINEIYVAVFIGADFLLNENINFNALNTTISKNYGFNVRLLDVPVDITGGKICVIFFYSPTCGTCHEARNILKDLKIKYPELNVKEYDIANSNNLILQLSYYEHYGVPTEIQGTFAVFIGDKYLVSADVEDGSFKDKLEEQINRYKDGVAFPDIEPDKEIVKEKFTSFTVAAVLIAGLVDSLNPCAIATLIFFIGYLSVTGRTRREVLTIGILYTLGIFITYMALGIGLYSILAKSASEIALFSKLVYPIIAIITLIFGFYSLYDFNKARKGKKEEMMLKLPKSVKSLIGRVIKHQVKLRYFALIAIITGVLISMLEFLCTGQIYLPTIMLVIATVPEFQAEAILLLFLYNLMFVLPLIIIFVLIYFGMKSEHLQESLDKNRALFKLLIALVFFGLGIWLLVYSIPFWV